MALFVLGAGATRGASFVDSRISPCLPPLDSDFFTQLQRVSRGKHQDYIKEVIKGTYQLFGRNFQVTLETLFTTIEHMLVVSKRLRTRRELSIENLERQRLVLMQALAAVFEESLTETDGRRMKDCEFHNSIVENMISKDRIISFNYDCLIDHSLKEKGTGKWNARYGYCFSLGARGSALKHDSRWQADDNPVDRNNTIRLMKLHGSLHFSFQRRGGRLTIILKDRPYTRNQRTIKFEIIPPEWNKQYYYEPYKNLWKQAADEVTRARKLVIIGYSFPPNDLHAASLFRGNAQRLKTLVLVNPDREARRRARDVLHYGINSGTRVITFDSLAEFARCTRGMWDR